MMQRPWDCAQPDEWLPRSLRLCWGGDSDSSGGSFGTGGGDWGSAGSGGFGSGGFDASGGIGGWGGDSLGSATGGGDWGSAGVSDLSGFNAAGDYASALANSPGGFYDTGGPGIAFGALGAEFGGTFGLSGISGQPGDPGGAFGSELDAGGGGLSGVGRAIESWGHATPATSAGMVGSFADLSGGYSGYSGYSGYGGRGSSDYGGGYAGGGRGSSAFGSFGTLGASNTGRGSEAPSPSAFADTAGSRGGPAQGPALGGRSDAPTRGEAEVSSVSQADQDAPAPSEGEPQSAPEAAPEAAPTAAPEAAPTAAPSAGRDTSPEPEVAPNAFGPQTVSGTPDYQGAPYADMGPQQTSQSYNEGLQALSDLTQSALSGVDYQGSPYADMGPQADWGSVFEGAAPLGERGQWGDLPSIYSTGISNLAQSMWDAITSVPVQERAFEPFAPTPQWAQNPRSFELVDPRAPERAQERIDAKDPWALSTYFSPVNQQTVREIANLLTPAVDPMTDPNWGAMFEGAAPATNLASQLGIENVGARQGIDPGTAQYGADPTDWGSVFEGAAPATNLETQLGTQDIGAQLGIDPGAAQYATAPDPATQLGIESIAAPDTTDWASVFEGAPTSPDWTSVFEGTPTSPDWTSVFEGAPSIDPNAVIDPTMESGPPVATPSTDDATTPGSDPALSGAPAAPGAPGQPGQPGAAPQPGGYVDPGVSPDAAVNAASIAADKAGVSPEVADAVTQAVYNAQSNYANPTDAAAAARDTALDKGATQEQADAIAAAVYDAAVSQAEHGVGTVPAPPAPAPATGLLEQAQPGTQAFIPGGRETNFEYGQPQAAPPGLLEQAQPGTQATIPGGRTTDFNYPSSTSRGIEPGAEQYGVEADDHDTPEPADSSLPQGDPNAPRPPGNIPGQLLGANGTYQNQRADNPQVNRNYRDSGRTDYPQGRPGIDFRTARQAGIQPAFRTEDINTHDLDARLIGAINRAMQDMPAGIRDGLTASSGMRMAHRGEALEHMMDPRTSQESVYSRGHPSSGGGGFPSARPGGSNHGHGRAIDFLSSPALSWLRANAGRYGLETIPGDHPHIQLQGARGNVGARPSAQEQADQRGIDAQNRQAAIDRGLIAPGRGQAPTQLAGVPTPRGRPAEAEAGIQPGAEQYAGEPLAPQPPPATLPPQDDPPAPRPPADIPIDIPVQTAPPRAGRADPVMLNRAIEGITTQALKGVGPQTTKEQAIAKGVAARIAMIQAGIPAPLARAALLDLANKTAAAMGYARSDYMGMVGSAIDKGIAEAMQGYNPAAPGPVQGPPSIRGLAKGGRVDDDEPVVVGEQGPEVFVPDQPGTIWPHIPQPGHKPVGGNIDRWPRIPAVGYPGRYGGVEREMRRQTRAAQDPVPSLMDMIDSGQLRLNTANWNRMLNDPSLIALGRSRIEDRRAYSHDYPY